MVNTELLEDIISRSGKKKEYLAEKLRLSRQGFYLKCKGINDFTATEVYILCGELGIENLADKERIFFSRDVPV